MKYCIECGTKLELKECFNCKESEGLVPFCSNCNEFRFPTFSTAVSTIIYNKDLTQILLIKQYGKDNNILVAGYVSKGENLEETLVREIKEEVGLDVYKFKFNASRYFERTNSLICNFIIIAENENIVRNSEVDYAKWYTLDEAKEAIYHGGIAEEFLNLSFNKLADLK